MCDHLNFFNHVHVHQNKHSSYYAIYIYRLIVHNLHIKIYVLPEQKIFSSVSTYIFRLLPNSQLLYNLINK